MNIYLKKYFLFCIFLIIHISSKAIFVYYPKSSHGGSEIILKHRPDISDTTYQVYIHTDQVCRLCTMQPQSIFSFQAGRQLFLSFTDTCSLKNKFISLNQFTYPTLQNPMILNPFTGDSANKRIFKTCNPQYPEYITGDSLVALGGVGLVSPLYKDTFVTLKDYWFSCLVNLSDVCGYWEASVTLRMQNFCESANDMAPYGALSTNVDSFHNQNILGFNNENFSYSQHGITHFSTLKPNSTAYFLSNPTALFYKNKPAIYHQNAIDPDGDSLVFSSLPIVYFDSVHGIKPLSWWWPFIPQVCNPGWSLGLPGPVSSGFIKRAYNCVPGTGAYPTCDRYNAQTNPFDTDSTFSINPQNGDITFTAKSSPQMVRVLVRCDEYRNGEWMGAVNRHLKFFIIDSAYYENPTLVVDTANLVNCKMDSNYVFYACKGNNISIPYSVKALPSVSHLNVSDNHTFSLPNANISYSNNGSDSVQVILQWQTTNLDTGWHYVLIKAEDSVCNLTPYVHQSDFLFKIYIGEGVKIKLNDTTICEGDSIQLTAQGIGGNLQWTAVSGSATSLSCNNCNNPTVYPTQTTQYVVQGSGNNLLNCPLSDTIVVNVVKKFTVKATDSTLCSNNEAIIKAIVSGNNIPVNYNWQPTSGIVGGNNNSSILIAPTTSNYLVSVSDTQGCFTVTDTAQLYYDNSFNPSISLNKNGICTGDTIELSVAGGIVQQWLPNYNIAAISANTAQAWPDSSIIYQAEVQSLNSSCRINLYQSVDVVALRADAGADVEIWDGEEVILGGPNMLCSNGCNVRWYPSEGLYFSFDLFPKAAPIGSKQYWVVLSNNNGTCTDRDTVNIKVKCTDIYIPNAFSPESQSLDDYTRRFGPRNFSVELDYFRVFNRWGQLMFETNDVNNRWDGKYKGVPQPVGVYVWVIKGKCPNGEVIEKKGNVTLLK